MPHLVKMFGSDVNAAVEPANRPSVKVERVQWSLLQLQRRSRVSHPFGCKITKNIRKKQNINVIMILCITIKTFKE